MESRRGADLDRYWEVGQCLRKCPLLPVYGTLGMSLDENRLSRELMLPRPGRLVDRVGGSDRTIPRHRRVVINLSVRLASFFI
jgi:hypothetical protein